MIRIDEITIGEFVEILAGNTEPLKRINASCTQKDTAMLIRNLAFEYKEIADPAGSKGFLARAEKLAKAKITVVICEMCSNLMAAEKADAVREILSRTGIRIANMSESRIKAEIASRIARAKREIADIEGKEDVENLNVRREFDTQTASMMAYFKFQIDTSSMKASIYASLVARFNSEIKAQLAILNKK